MLTDVCKRLNYLEIHIVGVYDLSPTHPTSVGRKTELLPLRIGHKIWYLSFGTFASRLVDHCQKIQTE